MEMLKGYWPDILESAPRLDPQQEKNYLHALAEELLDKKDPANYNQAIMDFGATICKPKIPLRCCVLMEKMPGISKGMDRPLPHKQAIVPRKKRWFYYFIVKAGKNKLWIRERTENDIWQNLYEFVLWESVQLIPREKLNRTRFFMETFGKRVSEFSIYPRSIIKS